MDKWICSKQVKVPQALDIAQDIADMVILLFQLKKQTTHPSISEIFDVITAYTKLTQVQAEVGSLHQAGVLTHGPNVEVHEDWQAGERCHSEPDQEEQVGQEHQLQHMRWFPVRPLTLKIK